MSKLKRNATFSSGTRPKLSSSLTSGAAASGNGGSGGTMKKAASVDFANVPEIMTTPAPSSPSVGRRTPVRSRRQSGNRHRHPSGNGNGSASGESTCSSTTSHCYNTWLPINPPMLPMAVGGPAHECCVSAPEENLRSYDPTDIHLSFAGCGFLGIYHIGVAAAFQHFMPDCHFSKLAGCSAGALAAAALVADIPVSKMASVMMELTEEARAHMFGPWNPYFHVTKVLIDTMDRILPDDIHVIANGRLSISVTKVMDGTNTIAENFSSKRELINAIAGSAFIPVFSGGIPTRYRGIRVIDGGFSKNILTLGDETITVAPFAGSAMISPMDDEKTRERDVVQIMLAEQGTNITMSNMKRMGVVLYPPPPKDLAKLLDAGFRDAHRFLRTRGMTACVSCLTVRTRTALVRSEGETESSNEDDENSDGDIEDDNYEDNEAWKKHLPKFQRGMCCEDHVDCDRHNAERLSLPDQIQEVIQRFMSESEQQLASYRAELSRSQQETLIGTMMRLFFKAMSYTPAVWLARWGITKTFDVTRFMFKFASEITPLVDYITDKKVIQMAEEILFTLVARVVGAQSLMVIPARPRGTGARRGYAARSKGVKGKPKPLGAAGGRRNTVHGHGPRLHRQNVDCDISITHLGGGIDDECSGSPGTENNGNGENSGLKTTEQEVEWLQVSVNATTDARHHLEPRSEEEARQFQAENLLLASRSGQVSRAISRVGSRIMSRRSSMQSSAMTSRRQSVSSLYQASESTPPGGNQTLDNIRRVTDARDSFLNYRYKDENGDMIMVNLYDISDTDPADILGDDVVDIYDDEPQQQQRHFSAEELAKMVDPEEVEEFRMRRMMEEMMQQQEQLLLQGGESPEAEGEDGVVGQHQDTEGAAAAAGGLGGGEDIRSDPESEWDLHRSVTS